MKLIPILIYIIALKRETTICGITEILEPEAKDFNFRWNLFTPIHSGLKRVGKGTSLEGFSKEL
jgi:hypothetical protein